VRLRYSFEHEVFRTALVELRRKAGMTQRQFARAARRQQSWIAKIESGDRYIRLTDILAFSAVLNIPAQKVADKLAARIPDLKNRAKSRAPHDSGARAWLVLLASYRPTRRRK
jgi:transcriptional regulator with XRE-family HTH domain